MYEVSRQPRFNKTGWILLLLIGIGLISVFYGCQFFQPKSEQIEYNESIPLDRRIGILKSLGGVKTSNQGTHLLQLDDGSTILLRSLQFNLDDPAYLGRTVEVRGLLTYTTDRKQIMDVMNIDLVQEEGFKASEAVSWKDYSNKNLEFSVKYRDDLDLKESEPGVVRFQRKIETDVTTQATSTTESESNIHEIVIKRDYLGDSETLLSTLGLKNDEPGDLLAAGMTRSKIGAESYDAIKKADGPVTYYYIQSGKSIYTISIDCRNDEKTLNDQNLFYEMLGTLKFYGEGFSLKQEEDIENDANESSAVKLEEESTSVPSVNETEEVAAPSSTPENSIENEVTGTTSETEETALQGYAKMESESFRFSVQYPKSWFYTGTSSTESGVIRHYEFGNKPLEEAPGTVFLDLMSGSVPDGKDVTINGKNVTTEITDGIVNVYVKGSGSRIYRISGPAAQQEALLNMAASLQD